MYILVPYAPIPPGSPALLVGCAGHAEAGREPGSLCLPLAAAEAGALSSLCVVVVRGPAMGLSLAGPWWLLPPPPLFCVSWFLSLPLGAPFFLLVALRLPAGFVRVGGSRRLLPPLPPPLVCLAGLPLLGSRCARAAFVFPASPLAASWGLLPPPSPLCLAVFVTAARCPVCFFAAMRLPAGFALVGSSRRLLPPPSLLFVLLVPCCSALLCALAVFVFPTWLLAAPLWLLLSPPFCVSRFSLLPLGAPFFSFFLCCFAPACLLGARRRL